MDAHPAKWNRRLTGHVASLPLLTVILAAALVQSSVTGYAIRSPGATYANSALFRALLSRSYEGSRIGTQQQCLPTMAPCNPWNRAWSCCSGLACLNAGRNFCFGDMDKCTCTQPKVNGAHQASRKIPGGVWY